MFSFERLSLNKLLNVEIQLKGFNTHIIAMLYIKNNCFNGKLETYLK
jgi:hypothetical protein